MEDFCRFCGASIPPKMGEGTCEKCDPTHDFKTGRPRERVMPDADLKTLVEKLIFKWTEDAIEHREENKRIFSVVLEVEQAQLRGEAKAQAIGKCRDELKDALQVAAGEASAPQSEICICAAVQFADGRIVRGHRHDSCFRTAEGWTPKPDNHGHVQGFITSRNRFVDRSEGARLQNAAGIESAHYRGPVNEELFSEDLYFDSHDRVAWNKPYTESPSVPPSLTGKER